MCEDGYQIILNHFREYRQRIRSSEGDSVRRSARKIPSLGFDVNPRRPASSREPTTRLTLNEKLPLAMLQCLVADGRQLTLEEIDRVLVYLLEKKAKMLTLPEGTLPPLPVYYTNGKRMDNRDRTSTGTFPFIVVRQPSFMPSFSRQGFPSVSNSKRLTSVQSASSWQSSCPSEASSSTTDQIRQILLFNVIELPPLLNRCASVSKAVHNDDRSSSQLSSVSQAKLRPLSPLSFSFASSCPTSTSTSTWTNETVTSYSTSNYSPLHCLSQSFPLNSSFQVHHPSVDVPTILARPPPYFYASPSLPPPPPLVSSQALSNSAAADAAAAIFQAYSQFNARASAMSSFANRQRPSDGQASRR